jgi:hypothetical protein
MSDTNAKIRGKGLEHTGVTEDHANQMYDRVGSHYVGIVDLKVVRRAEDDDGKRVVELVIESIELAPNDDVAESLRRMTRAVHYERGLAVNGGQQLPIENTDEPTVDQVRGELRNHEPDPEKDERDLEAKEAADAAIDAAYEGAAEQATDEPWEYEAPDPKPAQGSGVTSPFDVPDPEPTPAA